jgi:hypothetical protein
MEQQKNSNQNRPQQPRRPRPQRLRLPFDNRNEDPINWIYDNRVGLCVTLIAFLVFAIVFVVAKIDTSTPEIPNTIYIDFGEEQPSIEEILQEKERLEEEIRQKSDIDWSSVRNLSSNENALNESLEDEKGTDVSELNAAAEATEREMRANREAYEKGVIKASAAGKSQSKGESSSETKNVKRKGQVTVDFSFKDPVRYSKHLIKPAYRCEGGGVVKVSATLNQSGKVIAAVVIEGGDECMRATARDAALRSTFDINHNAPTKQQGTITYTFIPQ